METAFNPKKGCEKKFNLKKTENEKRKFLCEFFSNNKFN